MTAPQPMVPVLVHSWLLFLECSSLPLLDIYFYHTKYTIVLHLTTSGLSSGFSSSVKCSHFPASSPLPTILLSCIHPLKHLTCTIFVGLLVSMSHFISSIKTKNVLFSFLYIQYLMPSNTMNTRLIKEWINEWKNDREAFTVIKKIKVMNGRLNKWLIGT